MQIGGQFRRGGIATREQKRDRQTATMQRSEHQPFPLSESVPGQGQSAVSIAEHHIHPGEKEDQVGPASTQHVRQMTAQQIEVFEIAAMIRQWHIKITRRLPHREISATMHRETEDGVIALEAECVGIPLMHVDIDDQSSSDFLFSLKDSDGHADVVEDAEAFSVVRARMMSAAREIRGDAVIAGVPGGEHSARNGQSRASCERG